MAKKRPPSPIGYRLDVASSRRTERDRAAADITHTAKAISLDSEVSAGSAAGSTGTGRAAAATASVTRPGALPERAPSSEGGSPARSITTRSGTPRQGQDRRMETGSGTRAVQSSSPS